jgi:hypothetical protein
MLAEAKAGHLPAADAAAAAAPPSPAIDATPTYWSDNPMSTCMREERREHAVEVTLAHIALVPGHQQGLYHVQITYVTWTACRQAM